MGDLFSNPAFVLLGLAGLGGWVFTTWLKVRHGYPLEGSWGQKLQPMGGEKTVERLKLLTGDNARLAAEMDALKERVSVLERIATDRGQRLSAEIDNLRH